MAGDDESVLGKLPRSRPGSRSGKRDAPGRARATAGSRKRAPRPAPPPEPQSSNPVEAAARIATGAAGAGLRAASALTRETLRRLPRP